MNDELFDLACDNENKFQRLIKGIESTAARVVSEYEFPPNCIGTYKKVNKTETVFPLEMREFRRNIVQDEVAAENVAPAVNDEEGPEVRESEEVVNGLHLRFTCNRFATLVLPKTRSKFAGTVQIRLNPYIVAAVVPPQSANVVDRFKNNYGKNSAGEKVLLGKELVKKYVHISLDGNAALEYIERLMRYMVENFKSGEPMYGCCHLYEACSDARKCLNKDKMYATACAYRKNLLAGRIFYGKNRNI